VNITSDHELKINSKKTIQEGRGGRKREYLVNFTLRGKLCGWEKMSR
jgi:hypothetical protein